jgi:L-amino acid N-acyltransferase
VPLIIRSATESDRAAVLELAPRLREGVAPWRPDAGVSAAVRGWVEGSLGAMSDGDQAVLVAELDGLLVGFVTLSSVRHWSGELDAWIGELVVHPDAEGRGMGTSLVEAVIERAREDGHARISVSTGATNSRARRLYAKLGFEDEDVTLSRGLS